MGRRGGSGGGGEALRVEGVADVGDGGLVKGGHWKMVFKWGGSSMDRKLIYIYIYSMYMHILYFGYYDIGTDDL